MKRIFVRTRQEDYAKVLDIVSIDHYFIAYEETGGGHITVFVPDEELDALIAAVESKIDLAHDQNLIEVTSPDFVVCSFLDEAVKKAEKQPKKTPAEKLIDSTKPYQRLGRNKLILTSIAGIVALSGLFLNNSVLIIGAMLLSPILGPILGFAINMALGKARDSLRSLGVLFALLGSVFLISMLVTFLLAQWNNLPITEEIVARTATDPIYILVAILLGFASVLAFTQDFSDLLAGVAVAAALIPPVVVSGIVIILSPEDLLASVLLSLKNIVGLIAGALIATLVLDIMPRRGEEQVAAKKNVIRTSAVIAVLIGLLIATSAIM